MLNQQELAGQWNEVKGKLKQKWGKLSDDDVRSFNGNVDQLVGRIQSKTGESREAIEKFLSQLADEGSEAASSIRDKIEQSTADMAQTARQGYETLRQGYSDAEQVVQDRPGQAIAVAFGLGVLTGLGVAVMLRRERHESTHSKGRAATEQLGRHVLDALSNIMPESLMKATRR